MGIDPDRTEPHRFETAQCNLPGPLKLGDELCAVLSILALDDHLVHHALRELRGRRLGQQLQVHKIMNDVPVRRHETDAKSRRQRLGKPVLITTQAKRNLSSRSGIGGVLSAT